MGIPAATLLAQAKTALQQWPWVTDVEKAHGLPQFLLLAVGSRETNLNVAFTQGTRGGGGHGHGVWQYDDRFHKIPAGFDTNARQQADIAAGLLADLIKHFKGNLAAAMAAYNAGVGGVEKQLKKGSNPDAATTGKDYGSDVLARLDALTKNLPATPPVTISLHDVSLEVWAVMIATDPVTG